MKGYNLKENINLRGTVLNLSGPGSEWGGGEGSLAPPPLRQIAVLLGWRVSPASLPQAGNQV